MISFRHLARFAALPVVLAASSALAAPGPAFQQAILAELSPATRTEVQSRATGGNSVYEVLAVILLNNLQLAGTPNAQVVAVDFGRETAVVKVGEAYRVVRFDSSTLSVRN
ncbi:hypothetical protein [Roseococcus pinisoli]|uniref:Uncharacterized protein n=1 Tax=Roseococcus pinisoli TaxID=2835040 RepID=A0ABS5QB52_9PROT|nr:hypothetical protein [Roseococcus pinisoli]MBS7810668.1 hypothetical protein [Roseococcus pinisoli]